MDSYEGQSSDPLTLHKYLYCHANPVNGTDPSGNDASFSIGGFQVTMSIGTYLGVTAASYAIGKGFSAAYLMAVDGDLHNFEWFETSDLLSFVPGAVFAKLIKLPVQMMTRVGGNVVGKAFAKGGVQRVAQGFSQWFASTGGKLTMRTATGATIELEKGTAKTGFEHILQRHLVAFWNGTKIPKTTFWPSSTSAGEMLNLLKEAAGKYVSNTDDILLSNGIKAKLIVHGGKVTTFFPVEGPGVIYAKELVKAVP